MILNRKQTINLSRLQEKYGEFQGNEGIAETFDEFSQLIETQQVYSGAMKAICTKLEILDDEFQINHKHNPIHHIECRLKTPRSIVNKLMHRGYELSTASAIAHVLDIAGVRIICNYLEDVYTIEKLLLNQSDLSLISRKDYIENPKPNGYRSLHLILSVPVFLSNKVEHIPVEIQIRTIAMDFWASLEHSLRYKNDSDAINKYKNQLKDCASQLAEIEAVMLSIHQDIRYSEGTLK